MPRTSDIAFWDRIAPSYAAKPIGNMTAYDATLARVRAHLTPADRVLELGAGTGSTALRLAPLVASYTATDASAGMVEIAETKRRDAGQANLTIHRAEIDAAHHGGAPYDVVMAFNLLHLVPDLDVALAEIAEMLPSGGRFITKTPCLRETVMMRVMTRTLVPAMRMLGKAPNVLRFSIAEFDAALERAGLRAIETGLYPASTSSRFVVAVKR
ncbi:class I SAM-dependent methyltransferase [Litorisediminicola beolgyonensis]|uniref:Class I SAM-dependent methyltransferase n=1 Tax=Litorisediminicola beolgyonensis TaxID=1173614 RepID=A0ABW3ZFK2_9RHOB